MRVLGIDPGVTGAWAIVDVPASGPPVLIDIGDLPVREVQMSKRIARRLDVPKLVRLFEDNLSPLIDQVVVERLTGAPGITSTTAFSLGWTGATLDTVLTMFGRADYKQASPNTWKRALLVPADKQAAKAHATKIFGTDAWWPRAEDHNRAEAALLALYGALTKA